MTSIILHVFLYTSVCFFFFPSLIIAYERYCVAQSDVGDIQTFDHGDAVDSFFSLIKMSDGDLFLGSSNMVYKVNPETFTKRWNVNIPTLPSPLSGISCETIIPAAQRKLICQNHVSVIEKWNSSDSSMWLVCGSNSQEPNCWKCIQNEEENWNCTSTGNYELASEVIAFQPTYHASWLSTDGGMAFAATEQKSSKAVHFAKLSIDEFTNPQGEFEYTTNSNYDNWLNRPAFVGSPIRYMDYIYFFFRETATEYINAGKIIYPRVGRVCERDEGGTLPGSSTYFRTFLKARLNCSIASPFPFYFDEIQDVYQSKNDETVVYAVFTTPSDGPPASAVCAYSLKEIHRIFTEATYKGQELRGHKWLPKTHQQLDSTDHFGKCGVNYNNINDYSTTYKNYILIDQLIPNLRNFKDSQIQPDRPLDSPLLYCNNYRFTSIAVDDKYEPAIFMIGTKNMSIIKAFFNPSKSDEYGTIVSEIMLDGTRSEVNDVKDMIMYPSNGSTHVIATAVSHAFKVPIRYCNIYKTCELCVRAQDPHCKWHADTKSCVNTIDPDDTYIDVTEKCYISSKSQGLDVVISLQNETYSTMGSHAVNFYAMVLGQKGCNLNLNVSTHNNDWVVHEDNGASSSLESDIEYVTIRLSFANPLNIVESITIDVGSDCRASENYMDSIKMSAILSKDASNLSNNYDEIWRYDCELAKYTYDVFQIRQRILETCQYNSSVYTCPPLHYQDKDPSQSCPAK